MHKAQLAWAHGRSWYWQAKVHDIIADQAVHQCEDPCRGVHAWMCRCVVRTRAHHTVGQQTYDALLMQNKELMLSKLRTELCISDERHEELRQRLDSGEERPWVR